MKREPRLIRVQTQEHSANLKLKINSELEDFKGHFEGFPIFPGVRQIDLALLYAKRYLAIKGDFSGMESIKFQNPILPDAIVSLTLTWHPEKSVLHFIYQSQKTPHASGRILLCEQK